MSKLELYALIQLLEKLEINHNHFDVNNIKDHVKFVLNDLEYKELDNIDISDVPF